MRGSTSPNSSSSARAQRLRARDVVRAVEQHERLRGRTTSSRPGDAHGRERLGDDVDGQRRADERLGRRERDRGVVGLVRAVQRQEHVGVRRVGVKRSTSRPPTASTLLRDAEVDVAPQHACRGVAPAKIGCSSGIGLAEHERRARLHDARPSRPRSARASARGTRRGRRSTLVTTATSRVDDVRRVPRAAQADLDDRDVDRFVGEPAERGRGHDLEVRRVDADARSTSDTA